MQSITARLITLMILPILLVGSSFEVWGSSHGVEGYSEIGCNCHGTNPGSDTSVEIIGIPENYTFGERYELTIVLTGGPVEAEQGHRGGFNLKASNGEFLPKDSTTYITENGEITHDHSGANQRIWYIEWIAPFEDSDVRFTVAGNVVDGDHQPTDGDDWALAVYTSYGTQLGLSDYFAEYSDILFILFFFLSCIPLVYIYRKK
ncbi:MAG: choice-of-anchor V domain-containing protein [Candidatus Thalassarchaeaceae archaeon]